MRLHIPAHATRHHRFPSRQDLCDRLPGPERRLARYQARRDLRLARAERRRQDDIDRHHLRHRQSERRARSHVDGFDIVKDYRKAREKIGLVPQELHTDAFETVWATASFSRGLFGKKPDPAHIEKVLKDLSLWDKKEFQDHDTVGRHEATGDDRQGAGA